MSTTITTPIPPLFDEARLAVAGFLARYSGPTRRSYVSDLRQFFSWCASVDIETFAIKRGHIELWARSMEEKGLARATIGRRLSTVAGFYRICVLDGLIEHSPAEYVRRPKIDTDSATLGLDRMELSAFVAQGAAGGPMDHALACLLGLLGLRVSEACSINIEDLALERGHRTGTVLGKGSKLAVIPLPPRVARAVDLAAGERTAGALLLTQAEPSEPSRCHTDREPSGQWRRDHEAHLSALPTPQLHCCSRRRGAVARRPDRSASLRSQDDLPLRQGPQQPRSSRQLHRHRLRGRRQLRSVTNQMVVPGPGALSGTGAGHPITKSLPVTHVNCVPTQLAIREYRMSCSFFAGRWTPRASGTYSPGYPNTRCDR